jgi:hypothetical protein
MKESDMPSAFSLTPSSNPLPNSTFGDIGAFFHVRARDGGLAARLKLPYQQSHARHVDEASLRLFRWDEPTRSLLLVPASGVDFERRVVWGWVSASGLYGAIGIPLRADVLRTIYFFAMFSPDELRNEPALVPRVCGLILCQPDTGRVDPLPGPPGNLCELCLGIEVPQHHLPEIQLLRDRPREIVERQPPATPRVFAWGDNHAGQLGDGTTTQRLTPIAVLDDAFGVSASRHSLAVKTDGSVWAWGDNEFGALGDGTTNDRHVPVQVSGLGPGSGFIAVAAGNFHSLALKSDGSLWGWGWNVYGQLGDGTTVDRLAPVQVSGAGPGSNVVAIAKGVDHGMAVKRDGTILTWGSNQFGQLGDGTAVWRQSPVVVSGSGPGSDYVAIGAGHYHSFGVKRDGTLWSWGDNSESQLGDGTTTDRTSPVQVPGLTGVIAAAGGYYHSLALKNDGTVWSWGDNDEGQ